MKKLYPEATESQVWKLVGIRWPGEVSTPKKTVKKKIEKERKPRPQKLPWPENLITEIGLKLVFPDTEEYQRIQRYSGRSGTLGKKAFETRILWKKD